MGKSSGKGTLERVLPDDLSTRVHCTSFMVGDVGDAPSNQPIVAGVFPQRNVGRME